MHQMPMSFHSMMHTKDGLMLSTVIMQYPSQLIQIQARQPVQMHATFILFLHKPCYCARVNTVLATIFSTVSLR